MVNKSVIKEIKAITDKALSLVGKPEAIEFPKFSSSQLLILDYMFSHTDEVIYQRDFEEILKLSRATVSSVLGTLEKYNIIYRTVDEDDTRIKRVGLTKKAKDFYNCGIEKMQKLEKIATRGMSDEEINTLFMLLCRMNKNLEDEIINNIDK
ncbi:MAG: MarR family transcriptional regulator [Ruminococcus sp.]|nr:MarR family transcriptional regulator [Ruminococcus sp.]